MSSHVNASTFKTFSRATISWYKMPVQCLPSDSPTDAELKDKVMRMCEHGLKATGCNAVIRPINVLLRWSTWRKRFEVCGGLLTLPLAGLSAA
jgi:hypothetical protein